MTTPNLAREILLKLQVELNALLNNLTLDETAALNLIQDTLHQLKGGSRVANSIAKAIHSEAHYRSIVDMAREGIWLIDAAGNTTFANGELARIFGFDSPEEMIGLPLYQFMPGGLGKQRIDNSMERRRQGIAEQSEAEVTRRDGTPIWILASTAPILDEYGHFAGALAMVTDITERKRADDALRESEERFRSIADSAPVLIWGSGTDGLVTFVNEAWLRFTGRTLAEELGNSWLDILHPDDKASTFEIFQNALHSRQPYRLEYRMLHAQGEYRWLLDTRVPRFSPSGEFMGFIGSAIDITDRKQAEDAVRRSEERYRFLTESMKDVLWILDADTGYFVFVSPSVKRLLGFTPEEMMSEELKPMLHKIYNKADQQLALWQDRVDSFRNGTTPEGGYYVRELEQSHRDGTSLWLEVISSYHFNVETGHIEEHGVVRDITERKRAEAVARERDRLQVALEKEQELNLIKNNIMRTISHEFRTPLTIIASSAGILDQYYDRLDADNRHHKVRAVLEQVRRLDQMVEEISAIVHELFSKFVYSPAVIDLTALCRSIVAEVQVTLGSAHRIQFFNHIDLHTAYMDERLVRRILINLLSNAIKYSPPESSVAVQLSGTQSEAEIQVTDHGMGISEHDQKHIFEPFYRARSSNGIAGSGLGLSIVADCVRLHQGTITVESVPDRGTTFTVHLPTGLEFGGTDTAS